MTGPDRPAGAGSPAGRRWQRAVDGARAGLPVLTVPVALAGALVTPAPVLLTVGPLLGLVTGGTVLAVQPPGAYRPRARRAAVLVGAAGVFFLPFAAGVGLLGGAGLPLVVAVLALGCIVGVDALARACEDGPEARAALLERSLPRLTTVELLALWRGTEQDLRTAPGGAGDPDAVRVRAALLDELTRRDPAGVEQWLRSGSGPPDDHVRVHLSG